MARFTSNDGVGLHYTDNAPTDNAPTSDAATGRTVVLVHGYTAPATAWALTEDALLAAGHRVVCFDRRSTGESDTPAFGQRMARHGQDLAELLAHLELRGAVLVGASMGGNAIWAYVDLHGTDALAGVVIVDQTPKMINDAGWPHGFYGLDDTNSGTWFAAGIPVTGRGRPAEKSAAEVGRLVQRLGGLPQFRDAAAPETLGLLADHAHADWRDVITRAGCPVLMIAARESQFWPCEHAAAAVEGLSHGRAVIIEDAGHTVSFDQPDAFNTVLLEFLDELPA